MYNSSNRWKLGISKLEKLFTSNTPPAPHPPHGSLFDDQQPATNIDISADPSSARMPTSMDTNAEPVLSPLYLLILFSSLLSISGVPFPAPPPSPIEAQATLHVGTLRCRES